MIFKEFGSKDRPIIIFLHGGGLSWWSWKPQIEAFQKEYRVITPVIEGHGDAWNLPFISIQKSAERVIRYIHESCGGRVFALCGLSLGSQITVEILSQKPDIAEYAVIESALVYPIRMTTALTVPMFNLCYGLIKKRWFARLQAKSLNVPDEWFENYFTDSLKMTKESLINFTMSNGNYPLPSEIGKTTAKTLVLVGEKELSVMKKSAALLHNTIKDSTLKILEKAGHGEISLVHPDQYINLLQQFFAAIENITLA